MLLRLVSSRANRTQLFPAEPTTRASSCHSGATNWLAVLAYSRHFWAAGEIPLAQRDSRRRTSKRIAWNLHLALASHALPVDQPRRGPKWNSSNAGTSAIIAIAVSVGGVVVVAVAAAATATATTTTKSTTILLIQTTQTTSADGGPIVGGRRQSGSKRKLQERF